MLASLQAAATMLQPAKLHGLQLRSAPQVSKGFGVETSSAGARLTCSLHTDTKEFAAQSADAGKMTGLALVTSALLAWGAGAEDVPKRLTFDEIQSKTYMEVRGTGTANHCLKIEGGSFTFKAGKYNMKKFCLEPRSFTIKAEFQKTKLMTHLTYTLDGIEGPFDVLPDGTVKLEEKNRLDYVAVTVQLPGGERVPFLLTIKQLSSSGTPDITEGNSLVPSFTGSSFLDLKGRGGSTGYDNVVALPAGGRGVEEELAKENNKDNSSSTGKISLTMTKSKTETSEVIRFFESLLPSDTDMG